MPLALHGLEVGNEKQEMAVDHGLTEFVVPHYLPKALAPHRHLTLAMRRNPGSAVDIRGNLGHGEVPATPLGYTREIGRGRLKRGRGWSIAPALYPMAGATVPDKVLTPHTHRLSCAQWLLRRCKGAPEEHPPYYHDTKTIPLYALPPVHRRLFLCVRRSAAMCHARHMGILSFLSDVF